MKINNKFDFCFGVFGAFMLVLFTLDIIPVEWWQYLIVIVISARFIYHGLSASATKHQQKGNAYFKETAAALFGEHYYFKTNLPWIMLFAFFSLALILRFGFEIWLPVWIHILFVVLLTVAVFYSMGINRKIAEEIEKRIEVKFYDTVDDSLLKFAVIVSKTNGKWVFCKHKERTTFEVPGGHREKGETILETAKRELREETGATDFTIEPVCIYSVKGKTRINENMEDETFGMLFAADIFSFEELHSEMEKILITDTLVESWTYPLIQPKLIEEARKRGYI